MNNTIPNPTNAVAFRLLYVSRRGLRSGRIVTGRIHEARSENVAVQMMEDLAARCRCHVVGAEWA